MIKLNLSLGRIILGLVGIALVSGCSGGLFMKHGVFHYDQFSDVDLESTSFVPGFEENDFHVMIPDGDEIKSIRLEGNWLAGKNLPISGWEIATSYNMIRMGNKAYIFESGGMAIINLDSMRVECQRLIVSKGLELHQSAYMHFDQNSRWLYAAMRHIQSSNLGPNTVQIHRFGPDLWSKSVLEFPIDVDIKALSDGFIVFPAFNESKAKATLHQVFGPEATPAPGLFQKTLDGLYRSGILNTQGQPYSRWGSDYLWATSLHRPWALFYHANRPNGPSSLTSVLSILETPKISGVVFEPKFAVKESIEDLVLSPSHDLFLATVKTPGSDSLMLWLGRVALRDGMYRAECFKVQPFEKFKKMVFSRDGSTVLFIAIHEDKWQVGGARIADMITDINRRYPDAKLDLDALKAEVQ